MFLVLNISGLLIYMLEISSVLNTLVGIYFTMTQTVEKPIKQGSAACHHHQQHHHEDTNTSVTSRSTPPSDQSQALKKKKNSSARHRHHCQYRHGYSSTSTSISTSATSRSTIPSDQSSNLGTLFDKVSQDQLLAGIGSWTEGYDNTYGKDYPQEVDLNNNDKQEEKEN
ncbi:7121a2f1-7d90-436b-aee4-dd523a3d3a3f [Sclerotinia trifoliorum]|uniref:7121a2f1-7d90-436b-aee4-dd523a3d3a3f n=1 Tax=Sclerotinia trifoliorum TaxID=28548 RepID=A0A8H2VWM1_9HELO|nr:7121a2f1-7d90-436b-aee4-dd523a3d3a3f [Sclerotinia trifoliorum]